ncbi:MAG: hypothetical protein ACRDAQ_12130, partial [Cetobacterium sp.]
MTEIKANTIKSCQIFDIPENIKNSIFKLKSIIESDKKVDEAEELSLYLEYINAVEQGIIEEK